MSPEFSRTIVDENVIIRENLPDLLGGTNPVGTSGHPPHPKLL
jgi:hypothetical protein